MPKTKKTTRPAKQASKQLAVSKQKKFLSVVRRPYVKFRAWSQNLLRRRPHRSFRRTRRRDYIRALKLPGYWSMTNHVRRLLWTNKWLFILLAVTYAALTGLLVGFGSQSAYDQLTSLLKSTSGDMSNGDWGAFGQASLLLVASFFSSGLKGNLTDVQKVYSVIIILMIWMTTVWLLRSLMAGRKPRLRDGLYNAGSPIIATFLVGVVLVLQLLPLALAAIGITALVSTGILDSGPIAMIVTVVGLLLGLLSLYWVVGSFMALVIVTLPGMYPLQALKTAGDLVIGRRIRILLRLLWLLFTLILLWLVTMVPVILFDAWIKGLFPSISSVPFVPVGLLLVSSVTIVWAAAYVYIFYRKVVEDGSAPA